MTFLQRWCLDIGLWNCFSPVVPEIDLRNLRNIYITCLYSLPSQFFFIFVTFFWLLFQRKIQSFEKFASPVCTVSCRISLPLGRLPCVSIMLGKGYLGHQKCNFHPLSSTSIYLHPLSHTFIHFQHFHPLTPTTINFCHFYPLLRSGSYHFHPIPSAFITSSHFQTLLSTFIHFHHFHPFWSTYINSINFHPHFTGMGGEQ